MVILGGLGCLMSEVPLYLDCPTGLGGPGSQRLSNRRLITCATIWQSAWDGFKKWATNNHQTSSTQFTEGEDN